MSKNKPRIAIVGLGLIGGSIGMALRQADVASAVIGHDRDPETGKKAKKLQAVDRAEWNLISACEESDLIILAIPIDGIEETLKATGPYLKAGCVIADMASLKVPVLAMADDILPDHVHFVGMNPIVGEIPEAPGGLDAARADLFQDRLFCVVPSPKADPGVIQLASNLVSILGGKPLFVDAVEHDGLMGAVDQLPPFLALTLLETVASQPTWRELRKMAGPAFESGTNLLSNDAGFYADLFVANRENVVRWIDTFAASLASLRETLVTDGPEALSNRFQPLMEERNRWLVDRVHGRWEPQPDTEMPQRPNILVDSFLGGLWRKRPRPKEDE